MVLPVLVIIPVPVSVVPVPVVSLITLVMPTPALSYSLVGLRGAFVLTCFAIVAVAGFVLGPLFVTDLVML